MSRTIEHLTLQGIVASAMETLIESVVNRSGITVLDLSHLAPDLREAVRANLDMKAGRTNVFKTNVGGADLRISIRSDAVRMRYELQVVIGCSSERPLAL